MSMAGASPTSPLRKPRAGVASPATWSGSGCTSRTSHCSERAEAIPVARSCDRGRGPRPPAAENRTIWRCAVHRGAHRALDGESIAFGETHLFVGEGYLVSVRHGPSTSYTPVRERCESCPRALARGEDYILYAILDFIVDNYSPVLETIQEEVETMEAQVLASAMTRAQIERLYLLRRDLLRLRNAVGPLVEVCRRLEHDNLPMVRPTMQPLFRDVTDHVRTVQEQIDSLREVLAFAFEASLLVGQAQETAVSKNSPRGLPLSRSRPRLPASTA